MPKQTEPAGDGFNAPSKRGRKPGAIDGINNGSQEYAAGTIEPIASAGGSGERERESIGEPTESTPAVSGFPIADPFNAPAPSNQPGKRRGRKPGSTKEKIQGDLAATTSFKIEDALKTACLFLGTIASAPELELDDEEATRVANATRELARHYPAIQFAHKTTAWINFSLAMGTVFGPKVVSIYRRAPQEGRSVVMLRPKGSPGAATLPTQNNSGKGPVLHGVIPGFQVPVSPPSDFIPPKNDPEEGDSPTRSLSEMFGPGVGVKNEDE